MIRLAVRAPAEGSAPVMAALLELAPSGLEQVDGDGFVEFAVYGAPGELPSLPRGKTQVAGAPVTVRGEEVPDDWAERWRRFHGPVLVGGRLHLRPPWSEPAVRPGVREVVIDPGQAFGTGAHPTTRLSLELMLELSPRGSFADLGCGSGVLAIAAAKLGFRPVAAVDADRAAIDATLKNARANATALDHVARANLRDDPPPAADTTVANLMRPLLLRVASLMPTVPRAMVLSGLLAGEEDQVVSAFASMRERRRLTEHGWSAVLLERA